MIEEDEKGTVKIVKMLKGVDKEMTRTPVQ